MFTLAIIYTVVLVLTSGLALFASRMGVKADELVKLVQKLLMANNTDRAIRLVSGVSDTSNFAKGVKAMLVQKHRPWAIELAYQEALAYYNNKRAPVFWGVVKELMHLGYMGLFAGMMVVGEKFTPGVLICLGIGVASYIGTGWAGYSFKGKSAKEQRWLLKFRNILYQSIEYVPPQYKPRRMTLEELEEQQQRVTVFEREMTAARLNNKDFDPKEEFVKRVDESGMLPPI